MNEDYIKSLGQLQLASTSAGILASTENITNYRRIWARDSVICGLAGWVAEDEKVTQSFEASLLLLAENQGLQGEIPSNIALDEKQNVQSVSYGKLVGRVDALGWFVIGACHAIKTNPSLEKKLAKNIERALQLYKAWEYNGRGLVYTPQGGNWADDYLLEGYLLYDQLVRYWACKCCEDLLEMKTNSQKLLDVMQTNFILAEEKVEQAVNPRAYAEALANNNKQFWQAGFKPSGYYKNFDLFANALTLVLNLGDISLKSSVVGEAKKLMGDYAIVPAFSPVITEQDFEYELLQKSCGPEFKNKAHEYHNGGLWPMVNMWLAIGMYNQKEVALAEKVYQDINTLNKNNEWKFFEYYNGQTYKGGGTEMCTWTAAAPVMLEHILNSNGRRLLC